MPSVLRQEARSLALIYSDLRMIYPSGNDTLTSALLEVVVDFDGPTSRKSPQGPWK